MITRYTRALLFLMVMLASCASFAQLRVAITFGPPALPVYEQPVCPGEDYIWVPGYWAYDYDFGDYYWVPGTWVSAPEPGFFWTPGYWASENEAFIFHEGYWGPHVGFYGGINYGYGYFGEGYEGGRWDRGHFFYNREVNNVNVTVVHNVYNTTIINKTTVVNRVSYNGGHGGINARPRAEDEIAARDRHIAPVAVQTEHVREARSDPQQRASTNRGRPDVAATPRPSDFKDRAVVHASQAGGSYNPPPNRNNAPQNRAENNNNRPNNNDNRVQNNNVPRPGNNNIVHPKDIPHAERPAAPNTGDAKRDQKYQQQQEKLYSKQDQERQKLQQKQDQEHQKLQQRKVNEQRQQQVEQHHQQQTQKLQQRQEQQVQKMQTKQGPGPRGPEASRPR